MSLKRISIIAFYILFGLLWSRTVLMDYIGGALLHLVGASGRDLIISLMYGISLFFSFQYLKDKVRIKDILLYVLFLVVFLIQYVLFPANQDELNKSVSFFLIWTLPMYFLGLGYDQRVLFKVLTYISLVSIISMAFYKLVLNVGYMEQNEMSEDMFASYNLLPHLLLTLSVALKTKKPLFILSAIIGILLLFSFGTRGPLVCLILFLMLYLFFLQDRKWSSRVIIFSIGIVMLISMNYWQDWLFRFLDSFGMSNRIIDKFDEGILFESSARDNIRSSLLAYISSGPLWGFGICGDRILVGTYSHNLLLELVVSFGIVFGFVLFVYLTLLLIRGGFGAKLWEDKVFWLVLFCGSYVHLMFSGTFLNEPFLFLLIGISTSFRRNDTSFS